MSSSLLDVVFSSIPGCCISIGYLCCIEYRGYPFVALSSNGYLCRMDTYTMYVLNSDGYLSCMSTSSIGYLNAALSSILDT